MKEEDLEKIFERIKKIKGETRGLSFKIVEKFIEKEEGKEGVKKVEEEMVKLGYPISFEKIHPMNFYPLRSLAILFYCLKKLFNYNEKKVREIGAFRARSSFFVRLYLTYFGSIEKIVKDIKKIWRKAVTIGDVKVLEYDKEKKSLIFRLENYDLHPFQCQYFIGLISAFLEIIVKSKVSCEEIKCTFRGDDAHEFLIKW